MIALQGFFLFWVLLLVFVVFKWHKDLFSKETNHSLFALITFLDSSAMLMFEVGEQLNSNNTALFTFLTQTFFLLF